MRKYTEVIDNLDGTIEEEKSTGTVSVIEFMNSNTQAVCWMINHQKEADLKHVMKFCFTIKCDQSVTFQIICTGKGNSFHTKIEHHGRKNKQYDVTFPQAMTPAYQIKIIISKENNPHFNSPITLINYMINQSDTSN